jgi:hypothetical protein
MEELSLEQWEKYGVDFERGWQVENLAHTYVH